MRYHITRISPGMFPRKMYDTLVGFTASFPKTKILSVIRMSSRYLDSTEKTGPLHSSSMIRLNTSPWECNTARSRRLCNEKRLQCSRMLAAVKGSRQRLQNDDILSCATELQCVSNQSAQANQERHFPLL
ncbi:hypothetical protein DPMN_158637 [Dreissena polymorpha]|uniref:Uncharacterized protein n=1 Tax=Dreissena polymorpha TaxID=45954 RepID=A0A9D4IND8_DREPO|nr:hypothetical protein DPMN_158637 [Dreissena polymorpha]